MQGENMLTALKSPPRGFEPATFILCQTLHHCATCGSSQGVETSQSELNQRIETLVFFSLAKIAASIDCTVC